MKICTDTMNICTTLHFPVLGRCHARLLPEYFCKITEVGKTRARADLADRELCFGQHYLCQIHPEVLKIIHAGHGRVLFKNLI